MDSTDRRTDQHTQRMPVFHVDAMNDIITDPVPKGQANVTASLTIWNQTAMHVHMDSLVSLTANPVTVIWMERLELSVIQRLANVPVKRSTLVSSAGIAPPDTLAPNARLVIVMGLESR